jgi:hypothetical protein
VRAPNPLNLPPIVARNFAIAMRDYFAESDKHKQHAIAAHQLKVHSQYQNPREKPLRLSDIKAMFAAMKVSLVSLSAGFAP